MIRTPIVIADNGDVDFFASIDDAERYLEPWIVKCGNIAYDSEGRLLKFRIESRETPILFGLDKTTVDYVAIESIEQEPGHANELRDTLTSYLQNVGINLDGTEDWTLHELVKVSAERIGFTV